MVGKRKRKVKVMVSEVKVQNYMVLVSVPKDMSEKDVRSVLDKAAFDSDSLKEYLKILNEKDIGFVKQEKGSKFSEVNYCGCRFVDETEDAK